MYKKHDSLFSNYSDYYDSGSLDEDLGPSGDIDMLWGSDDGKGECDWMAELPVEGGGSADLHPEDEESLQVSAEGLRAAVADLQAAIQQTSVRAATRICDEPDDMEVDKISGCERTRGGNRMLVKEQRRSESEVADELQPSAATSRSVSLPGASYAVAPKLKQSHHSGSQYSGSSDGEGEGSDVEDTRPVYRRSKRLAHSQDREEETKRITTKPTSKTKVKAKAKAPSDSRHREYNLWEPSDTPEESWSDAEGANEKGEWLVDIVSEEVDLFGRIKYEARWSRWQRPDGTNTTWVTELNNPSIITQWKRHQTLRRNRLAAESTAMDIGIWTSLDIHNTNTRLRAHAFKEKCKKRKGEGKGVTELERKRKRLTEQKLRMEEGMGMPVDKEDKDEAEAVNDRALRKKRREEKRLQQERRRGRRVFQSDEDDGEGYQPGQSDAASTDEEEANRRRRRTLETGSDVEMASAEVAQRDHEVIRGKARRPVSLSASTSSVAPPKPPKPPSQPQSNSRPEPQLEVQPTRKLRDRRQQEISPYVYTLENWRKRAQPLVRPLTSPDKAKASASSSRKPLSERFVYVEEEDEEGEDEDEDELPTRARESQLPPLPAPPSTAQRRPTSLFTRTSSDASMQSSSTVVESTPSSMPCEKDNMKDISDGTRRRYTAEEKGKGRMVAITVEVPPFPAQTRRSQVVEQPKSLSADGGERIVRKLPSVKQVNGPGDKRLSLNPAMISQPQQPPPVKYPRRVQLENEWNAITKAARAAKISIKNDVDDEEIPSLPPGFQYVEHEYIYLDGVPRTDDDMLVGCDCEMCSSTAVCGCQEPSEITDERGRRIYAYDAEGLFTFEYPVGYTVLECNKHCRCSLDCRNRVSQRPRQVPIEIFKTEHCGWGVRSSVHVEKGTVIGRYAGKVMTRDQAETLEDEEKSYCFDLDGQEWVGEEDHQFAFTVDSMLYGNWSRFINHSCTPNMRVFLVCYDTVPEMRMPYIAFVALEDILAQTEFTVDYDPSAAEALLLKKKTKKGKKHNTQQYRPPGSKPCLCGSSQCRGWVRT